MGAQSSDATAMNRHARVTCSGMSAFRSEASIPATPTTPATSATQPFPATPSSPENNGASSNGSAQREHACNYPGCTKTFDRRYNLTVHFRRHTDEMPYPCKFPGCPQKFKWRSSQSHHMKTRHQGGLPGGRGGRNSITRQATDNNGGNRGFGYSTGNHSDVLVQTQTGVRDDGSGLTNDGTDESKGSTYKRTFSPRKRQRIQRGNP